MKPCKHCGRIPDKRAEYCLGCGCALPKPKTGLIIFASVILTLLFLSWAMETIKSIKNSTPKLPPNNATIMISKPTAQQQREIDSLAKEREKLQIIQERKDKIKADAIERERVRIEKKYKGVLVHYYNFETLEALQDNGFRMISNVMCTTPDGSRGAKRTFLKDITRKVLNEQIKYQIEFAFTERYGSGIWYWIDVVVNEYE